MTSGQVGLLEDGLQDAAPAASAGRTWQFGIAR